MRRLLLGIKNTLGELYVSSSIDGIGTSFPRNSTSCFFDITSNKISKSRSCTWFSTWCREHLRYLWNSSIPPDSKGSSSSQMLCERVCLLQNIKRLPVQSIPRMQTSSRFPARDCMQHQQQKNQQRLDQSGKQQMKFDQYQAQLAKAYVARLLRRTQAVRKLRADREIPRTEDRNISVGEALYGDIDIEALQRYPFLIKSLRLAMIWNWCFSDRETDHFVGTLVYSEQILRADQQPKRNGKRMWQAYRCRYKHVIIQQ